MFVDRNGRSLIAAAQAGDSADFHVRVPELRGTLRRGLSQSSSAPRRWQDISLANAHVRFGRRRQMKMRIKAGHAVKAIQRHIDFRGKRLQFLGRQIAELPLNIP